MIKLERKIMAMPVSVTADTNDEQALAQAFRLLEKVDQTFSTYKSDSEISLINAGRLSVDEASPEVREVLEICEETKRETNGYFDIERDGRIDPSGVVKGWAIQQAAEFLRREGVSNFLLEIAGDMEVSGRKSSGERWRIGLRNPFAVSEIFCVLELEDRGVATSGAYFDPGHIYNPHGDSRPDMLGSMSIIASNICDADRYATAAYVMGETGISWVAAQEGLEGCAVTLDGKSVMTEGFRTYVV